MKEETRMGQVHKIMEGRLGHFFRPHVRFSGLFHAAVFLAFVGTIASFFGEFAWWLDLASHFRVHYAVLFAGMGGLCLLGRKWRWALAAGALLLINAVPVGRLLYPRAGVASAEGKPCHRALLINVNTKTGNPARVMEEIRRTDPDFLVLEEISEEWLVHLAPVLSGFPHQLVEPREDNFGIGLFSRRPWTKGLVLYLGSAGVPSVWAQFEGEGSAFILIGTHPLPPGGRAYSAYRNEQLEQLAEQVSRMKDPVLVLGDLNVTPWSPHFKKLLRNGGLQNSSQGRGLFASWPAFAWPFMIPIDHALHTEGIELMDKRIGPDVGSDHYPLVVEFTVRSLSGP